MLSEPVIIMPGDTRRVVISGEGNGGSIRRIISNGRRSNGRGNVNSERNQTLLIDFFRQNRRRARAAELDRERRDADERMRGGGLTMRIDDDDDDGKKHSSFNFNFNSNFNLNFNRKPFA